MTVAKESPTWGTGGAEVLTACAIRDTRPIIHTLGFLLYCFAGAKHALKSAVANPTVSGFLSCPKFYRDRHNLPTLYQFRAGCADLKRRRHGSFHVTNTLARLNSHSKEVKRFIQSQRGDMSHV